MKNWQLHVKWEVHFGGAYFSGLDKCENVSAWYAYDTKASAETGRRTSAPAEELLLFVPFVNLCALGPIFFFLKKIPKILWNEYKLNNDKLNCKLG